MERITMGILSPSTETREQLRSQLEASGYSSIVEGEQYCAEKADRVTRRFVEAQPQIIFIDMQESGTALQALRVLHEALPRTWLFVSSSSADSQLIIETMRAGAREFLPRPVSLASLSQALARFSAERQKARENKRQGKVYCVTSAKGGAGTTTVTVNLAVSLAAAQDAKVALVDLGSPMGDAAEYLNLKPQFGVSDALQSAQRLDSVLLETFVSRTNGMALLPGFREFNPGLLRPDALAKVLQVTAETYTHVFIDMFCSHDHELLEVVTEFSTAVIVVLTSELPALWRTDRLIRLFEKIGGSEKLRLVINRDTRRQEISGKEIEKTLKHSIYWKLPNNYSAAINAVNLGKPLVSVNHSTLASSYLELTQSLTGIPLRTKPRGLFS